MTDIQLVNHGSVVMVACISEAARQWASEAVAIEDWAWMGEAFACEPRYVAGLVELAEEALG
jgi:hypothetical protein